MSRQREKLRPANLVIMPNTNSNTPVSSIPRSVLSRSSAGELNLNAPPMYGTGLTPPQCNVIREYSDELDDDERKRKLQEWFENAAQEHGCLIGNFPGLSRLGPLGEGSYGVVYKTAQKQSGVIMAQKVLGNVMSTSANFKSTKMELNMMLKCRSPHIVSYYGAFFNESTAQLNIFMEYMNAGSLDICVRKNTQVPEPMLRLVAKSVLSAIGYLQDELKIMHRDIKPSNILVNTRGQVKLSDFGISGELDSQLAAKTCIGCCRYMAPERLLGGEHTNSYTVAADVWSLGLTILELAMARFPYPEEAEAKSPYPFYVLQGAVPEFPSGCCVSRNFQEFVKRCLQQEPSRRSSISDLLWDPCLLGAEASIDVLEFIKREMCAKPTDFVTVQLLYNETVKIPSFPPKSIIDALEEKLKDRRNQNLPEELETCKIFLIEENIKRQVSLTDSIGIAAKEGVFLKLECNSSPNSGFSLAHTFQPSSFLFTVCEGCHKRIYKGYHCVRCGVKFHEHCSARIPQLCGKTKRRISKSMTNKQTNDSRFF